MLKALAMWIAPASFGLNPGDSRLHVEPLSMPIVKYEHLRTLADNRENIPVCIDYTVC